MPIKFTIHKCPTHCERCKTEFNDNNLAVECPCCDAPTLCQTCVEKYGDCKCSERLVEQKEWEKELRGDI